MKKNIFVSLFILFSLFACQLPKTSTKTDADNIRINQIGFYPGSVKQFTAIDVKATTFDLIDSENQVVFSGDLINKGIWEASGEQVSMGDFSDFKTPGNYKVQLADATTSYPFAIKNNLYQEALNASIKSYYFQRASMEIEEKFGGIYKRKAGHLDTQCKFHPSSGKEEGFLSAPGGWYDAGDYGKYVVNASVSVSQMLLLLEQYPNAVKDGALNIPESGNDISDLWDELKYELDWILTMQDEDGGVYHKLTAKSFSGFIMPEAYDLDRYIIGKGTAASLNFAAVLAQASRLYSDIDSQWSATALSASKKAWNWALENDKVAFTNPEDVSTGSYDDTFFDDDFYWAAAELYLTTQKEDYLPYLEKYQQEYKHEITNSWKFFVRNLGFHSLLANKEKLEEPLANSLTDGHLELANKILGEIEESPYKISLEKFVWGSNSDILNKAMILCVAHSLTEDEKYIKGAEQLNDYIYGKNATGYSFMTGFGSKQVMFPHHRPSGADGIDQPIPGFIAGGPNKDKQDKSNVDYPSAFPAKAFVDAEASYASNEVCLNWNAPAVYVLGYLQQVRK